MEWREQEGGVEGAGGSRGWSGGSRRVEWREQEGGVEEQESGVEEQEGVKWPCCCWCYELPDL